MLSKDEIRKYLTERARTSLIQADINEQKAQNYIEHVDLEADDARLDISLMVYEVQKNIKKANEAVQLLAKMD